MNLKHIKVKLAEFRANSNGDMTVQYAAFAGALGILVAFLAAPALDNASKQYADNRALGIDTVITGSIEKSKTYKVRKSVLDNQDQ